MIDIKVIFFLCLIVITILFITIMITNENFKLPSALINKANTTKKVPMLDVSELNRHNIPNCKAPLSIQLPGESAQQWARRRAICSNIDITSDEELELVEETGWSADEYDWFLCKIKTPLPGESVARFNRRMRRCANIPEEEEAPQSTSDLPPPPGASSSSNEICVSDCINGYRNIVCTDRNTGTVIRRQSTSTREMDCCRNECNNNRNTWRTICEPDYYIDSETPCYEPQPTKL